MKDLVEKVAVAALTQRLEECRSARPVNKQGLDEAMGYLHQRALENPHLGIPFIHHIEELVARENPENIVSGGVEIVPSRVCYSGDRLEVVDRKVYDVRRR